MCARSQANPTQHSLCRWQLHGFAVSAAIKAAAAILAAAHREARGEGQPQLSEPEVPNIFQPSPRVALTGSAAQSGDMICLRSHRETRLAPGFLTQNPVLFLALRNLPRGSAEHPRCWCLEGDSRTLWSLE